MRLAARAIVFLRWPIVLAWIAGTVAAVAYLPTIGEVRSGAIGALVPEDAEAVRAEIISQRLFRLPAISREIVVRSDPGGLSEAEQARFARAAARVTLRQDGELAEIAAALPVTTGLERPLFGWDDPRVALAYLYFRPETDLFERVEVAREFAQRRIGAEEGGFVGVTGSTVARAEQAEIVNERLPLIEIATGLLVALVVGLHFRALGAPLVNLLAVVAAYLVSSRLLALAGREWGIAVPREVEPVIVVLVFGVVTDYAIFYLSRFRARLGAGDDRREAARESIRSLSAIIIAAGLTVAAATASLVVAQLDFFEAFGPGMALSVLVALLVAITLVPAMLAIGGGPLFWPRRPDGAEEETATEAEGRPHRTRVTGFVTRHPLVTTIACVALLLGAASGLLRTELGDPLIVGLPENRAPHRAYEALASSFVPGAAAPAVVLVRGEGVARRDEALAEVQREIAASPGVARVLGPADVPVDTAGVVETRAGDAARYVVLWRSNPLGARAIDHQMALERRLRDLLGAAGLSGAEALVAGDTALVAETVERTVDDLVRVAPAALGAVFLVTAIFLRALVAPLFIVISSVLALAAALGLATYLFQVLLNQDGLVYYAPFASAVLLLSLGSDYSVFLTGRIWREARERPMREAVRIAGARAATPITTAGIVLALSFALLAFVPLRPFQQIAFTMAAGLLVDAFLVRTLLVPALLALFGERSGWPGSRLSDRAGTAEAPA